MPRNDEKDGYLTGGFVELNNGAKIPVNNAVLTSRLRFLVEGMLFGENNIRPKKDISSA